MQRSLHIHHRTADTDTATRIFIASLVILVRYVIVAHGDVRTQRGCKNVENFVVICERNALSSNGVANETYIWFRWQQVYLSNHVRDMSIWTEIRACFIR